MDGTKENTSTTQPKSANKTKDLNYVSQNLWNYGSKEAKNTSYPFPPLMALAPMEVGETPIDAWSSN